MEVSLFYFGCPASGEAPGMAYRLMVEGARFADRHGLAAVWTPERHFHPFGGSFPNPALAAAALATCTERVALRAGSIVLPIHDPLHVVEDWAMVDALSGGRVGVSFTAGWHDQDFLLHPDAYERRREILWPRIAEVRRLWRGESTVRPGRDGSPVEVRVQPRPVQAELPVWVTAAGTAETFVRAGREGTHLLTHLLGIDFEGLAHRVKSYRAGRASAGLDPAGGHVTLMMHTCLGQDLTELEARVRSPLRSYIGRSLELIQRAATPWAFGAFRQSLTGPAGADHGPAPDVLRTEDREAILDRAFDRHFHELGLFGPVDRAIGIIAAVAAAGVDEVACLVDFGLPADDVLGRLPALAELQARVRSMQPFRAAGTENEAGGSVADRGPIVVEGTSAGETPSAPDAVAADTPASPDTAAGEPGSLAAVVREIWCEVLGVPTARPQDDFFDSGGHSLSAMILTNRVRSRLGYDLPVVALFAAPTLAEITAAIAAGRAGTRRPPEPRAAFRRRRG